MKVVYVGDNTTMEDQIGQVMLIIKNNNPVGKFTYNKTYIVHVYTPVYTVGYKLHYVIDDINSVYFIIRLFG